MPNLIVHDKICEPARPTRRNEDAIGTAPGACFVFDGATGLGGNRLIATESSDAAWVAELARDIFEEHLADPRTNTLPTQDLVGIVNSTVAQQLDAQVGGTFVEDWAWPVSGFEMIRVLDESIEISGLGDCVCLLTDATGDTFSHTPLPDMGGEEAVKAREALARVRRSSAASPFDRDPIALDHERAFRSRYNRPGAEVWTLGRATQAQDHISFAVHPVRIPAFGLLCSDGFGALIDKYRRYDGGSLIEAARNKGLAKLYSELRAIEASDPEGLRYPRFKHGDDASAILFEIA